MKSIEKNQNRVFIFFSGLGESEDVWKPIVEKLKPENYQLLAVPGFGNVEKLDSLTQINFNIFLENYLSQFIDKEIYLVGHSLGAVLLLGANDVLKDTNAKLLLLQFPYASKFLSKSSLFILKKIVAMPLSRLHWIQKMLGTKSRILQKIYSFVGRIIDGDIAKVDKILDYPMFIETFKNADTDALRSSAQVLINFDYMGILESITIPVLIIQGGDDKRINVNSVRSHLIKNKNVKVVWIDRFAHSGFIVEPERIVPIMQESL